VTVDLTTTYLGLELAHPVVASAGPATARREHLERLAEAGVAAVVLPSLFEEEITATAHEVHGMLSHGAGVFGEALSYLPEPSVPVAGPDAHLALVAAAKEVLGDRPVVASLNGVTVGGWTRYAADLVEAGADAIELNVHLVAADVGDTAADVERRHLDVVRAVRDAVDVPLAVKLSPSFSALAQFASDVVDAGADGLVLFNRFPEPDIDLDTLEVVPHLLLSNPGDLSHPLRWIGLLHGRLGASLALSTGVHEPDDVVKAVLAGADAVMTTSALLRHGPEHVAVLRDGLATWLDEREYDSVRQACGSVSAEGVGDPEAYVRASYVATLRHWSTTITV
jgi:dihydroorotate dehydrogenase (fumarate)